MAGIPSSPAWGPSGTALQTRELIVKTCSRVPTRSGRQLVRVRVVGNGSLGWAEAAIAWGAELEAVVASGRCKEVARHVRLPDCLLSLSEALELSHTGLYSVRVSDHPEWGGAMFATVRTDEESQNAKLFDT